MRTGPKISPQWAGTGYTPYSRMVQRYYDLRSKSRAQISNGVENRRWVVLHCESHSKSTVKRDSHSHLRINRRVSSFQHQHRWPGYIERDIVTSRYVTVP